MSGSIEFTPIELVPAGREFLRCSCAYPKEFMKVDLPPEEHALSDPARFLPLLVTMASYGAVLFTVGARPAFGDGTVRDWAKYLAEANGLEFGSAAPATVGGLPGVQIEAAQPSEAGRMRVRSIFVEDGGRLFNIACMAPEQIWPSVEPMLTACLHTFRLTEVRGPTARLGFDAATEQTGSEKIEHPKPSADIPTLNPDEDGSASPHANANPAPAEDRPTQPQEVALASDDKCLDPEHPVNINLRDGGVGLVPRILQTSTAGRYSLIGAGAIERAFKVPFGWHAIDDGRRTLVFDKDNAVQINFDLRRGTADDIPGLFQSILADLVGSYGDFQFVEFEAAGFKAIGCKDLPIDGETLQQCYLAAPSHRDGLLLVARVTAANDRMTLAMNAAEVMLTSMQDPPSPAGPTPSGPSPSGPSSPKAAASPSAANGTSSPEPEWWQRAQQLEAEGRLEEAEQTILKAVNHLGGYSQVAHLYELRGNRMSQAGHAGDAQEAYRQSARWMDLMASQATSGGEGAALSHQAKEHRKRLGL